MASVSGEGAATGTAPRAGINARDGDRRALARAVSAGLTVLLVLVMLVGLGWGAADTDVISALLARFGLAEASLRDLTIVWDIRAPRVLTGALVGAGLAVSGAILQGLFRNPLALSLIHI